MSMRRYTIDLGNLPGAGGTSRDDTQRTFAGLDIILGYLNNGNTLLELQDIQTRAQLWCREYYRTNDRRVHMPVAVAAAHRRFLDITIPSWLRLDDYTIDAPLSTRERPGPSSELSNYSEPSFLLDPALWVLLQRYDKANAMEAKDGVGEDEYSEVRVPVTAMSLCNSPIGLHLPEVICILASFDVEFIVFGGRVDVKLDQAIKYLEWAKGIGSPLHCSAMELAVNNDGTSANIPVSMDIDDEDPLSNAFRSMNIAASGQDLPGTHAGSMRASGSKADVSDNGDVMDTSRN